MLKGMWAGIRSRHGCALMWCRRIISRSGRGCLGDIARRLKSYGIAGRDTRIVVEKPFGRDRQSAQDLNTTLAAHFDERQIYRIDHYLGKETVQNLMALRFGNLLFEPLWNAQYIDHIQITVAETVGVGGRGAYYDQSGAMRDMVQNHLMQLFVPDRDGATIKV